MPDAADVRRRHDGTIKLDTWPDSRAAGHSRSDGRRCEESETRREDAGAVPRYYVASTPAVMLDRGGVGVTAF